MQQYVRNIRQCAPSLFNKYHIPEVNNTRHFINAEQLRNRNLSTSTVHDNKLNNNYLRPHPCYY